MNTINNNIAFGAKLDCSNLQGCKSRWSKIASEFEKKTKKYPNDVFSLKSNGNEIYFNPKYSDARVEKRTSTNDYGVIPMETVNELETFSAEKVADILKRMFVLRKKADTMLTDYCSFENKYNLAPKVEGNIIDDFFGKFWNLREAFVKNRIKEDAVLKNIKGIEII